MRHLLWWNRRGTTPTESGGVTANFAHRALGPQNPPKSTKYPKTPILGRRVPNFENSHLGLKSTSYAINVPMVWNRPRSTLVRIVRFRVLL